MYGLTALSLIAGIVLLIVHQLRISSLKEYKQKYDYLSTHDARMIFYAFLAFGLAITFYLNSLYNETATMSLLWFFVRFFVAICGGTLVIYVAYLMLKYSYPSTLDKKLKKWRYKTRVNTKTGNNMKLLSEEEEDVHLDEGMQAEENVFSVDYDVWVDEETGDVQIEKYPGHLQAHQCNSCGFQTMKLKKEEITIAPTQQEEGELIKNYQCIYCSAKRSKTVKVARLSETDANFKLPEHLHFKEEDMVKMVSIEVHISTGKTHIYEFSTTGQAAEFLKAFNLQNVND